MWRRKLLILVVLVVLSSAAGMATAWGLTGGLSPARADASAPATPQGSAAGPEGAAERYVRAMQRGDAATVVGMTQWMRDRLELVRATQGPAAAKAERERLLASATARGPAERFLGRRGIADRFVFLPDASVEVVGFDDGPERLHRPVARRTWLRVTYPHPLRAVTSEDGSPVHTMVVGVSVSETGFVLKTSVAGNVEIDHRTVSHDWPDR
jgi:hypothetical protein